MAVRSSRERRIHATERRDGVHPATWGDVAGLGSADQPAGGSASRTRPTGDGGGTRRRPAGIVLLAPASTRGRGAVRRRSRPASGHPGASRPTPRLPRDDAVSPHDAAVVHAGTLAHAGIGSANSRRADACASPRAELHAHPHRAPRLPAAEPEQPQLARVLSCPPSRGNQCAGGLVERPLVLSAMRRRFSARRRALSATVRATSSSPVAARSSSA